MARRFSEHQTPLARDSASDRRDERAQEAAHGEDVRRAIAQRAYDLYESRGGADGHDMEDWLQAEYEIRGRPAR